MRTHPRASLGSSRPNRTPVSTTSPSHFCIYSNGRATTLYTYTVHFSSCQCGCRRFEFRKARFGRNESLYMYALGASRIEYSTALILTCLSFYNNNIVHLHFMISSAVPRKRFATATGAYKNAHLHFRLVCAGRARIRSIVEKNPINMSRNTMICNPIVVFEYYGTENYNWKRFGGDARLDGVLCARFLLGKKALTNEPCETL